MEVAASPTLYAEVLTLTSNSKKGVCYGSSSYSHMVIAMAFTSGLPQISLPYLTLYKMLYNDINAHETS